MKVFMKIVKFVNEVGDGKKMGGRGVTWVVGWWFIVGGEKAETVV